MRVTIDDILQGKEYDLHQGIEYVVADGVVVKMKPITHGLYEDAVEELNRRKDAGDPMSDYDFAKLITNGAEWPEVRECFMHVPTRIGTDFMKVTSAFAASLVTSEVRSGLSAASSSPASQDGPESG